MKRSCSAFRCLVPTIRRRRIGRFEKLESRHLLAVEVVAPSDLKDDALLDFGTGIPADTISGQRFKAEVGGKAIDLDATFTADAPNRTYYDNFDGIPGFKGTFIVAEVSAAPERPYTTTIKIVFNKEIVRFGFDFARYRPESVGDRVTVTLFNKSNQAIGSHTFATTTRASDDSVGFAGLSTSEPAVRAELRVEIPLNYNEIRETGETFSLDNLRIGLKSIPKITKFTNKKDELAKLAIDYELKELTTSSFTIQFYKNDVKIGFSIEVTKAALEKGTLLSLPSGKSAASAFQAGKQTIYLNPIDSTLASALLDENVDVLKTDVKDSNEPKVPFRGFYQADSGSGGAVRPGPDGNDDVTLKGESALYEVTFGSGAYRANFDKPSSVLVVTTDGDDIIRLVGASGKQDSFPTVTAWGGSGEDKYLFEASIAGSVRIKEDSQGNVDTLNFSKFNNLADPKHGVRLNLSNAKAQKATKDLGITFLSPNSIENVIGSNQADLIIASLDTSIKNTLRGEGGNDLLVGGQGDDDLHGGPNNDLLIGDGFTLSDARWIELADAVLDLEKEGMFSFGTDLVPAGDGKDVINDGGGFDIAIGGGGDDTITGREGTLVFGDAFRVKTNPVSLDFSKIYTGFSAVLDVVPFELQGQGLDTITVNGGFNLVMGGSGDDTINGGNTGLDLLFGNDGNDTIDGKNGSNLIVGGENPAGTDELLQGGDGVNVIVGNSLTILPDVEIDFTWSATIPKATDVLFDVAFDLKLSGGGDNRIVLGPGTNLVLGGKDVDTIIGSAENRGVDVLFGNDGSDDIDAGNGTNIIVGGYDDGVSKVEKIKGGSGFDLIFGDSITLNPGAAFVLPSVDPAKPKDAVKLLTNLVSLFKLEGAGRNEIVTGDGVNFVLGGDGRDIISAGNSVDVLFGNNGDDDITGAAGFNFMMGGDGDDKLTGGTNTDIAIGDSLKITTGVESFDPKADALDAVEAYIDKLMGLSKTSSAGKPMAFGLELIGTGDDTIVLGDGLNLAFGGDGKDTITGGNAGDVIYGGNGNDVLNGMGGADLILGGNHNDTITGGPGANFLFGDNASLEVSGGFNVKNLLSGNIKDLSFPSFNLRLTGNGQDTINGGDEFDFIVGGNGSDTLKGGDGLNLVLGDDFEVGPLGDIFSFAVDLINPLKSATLTLAKAAVARLYEIFKKAEGTDADALANSDTYDGGKDSDIVLGGAGSDTLRGNDGWDLLIGGYGADTLDPGKGGTLIKGEEFFFKLLKIDNLAYGGPGDDIFVGGDDNDFMFSDLGSDDFEGGAGDDMLFGGEDDDILVGGLGNDFLDGGSGVDRIESGVGVDQLTGEIAKVQVMNLEDWRMTQPQVIDGVFHLTATNIKSAEGSVLTSFKHPWQNFLRPTDVDNNGTIEPLDALLIINEVSRRRYSDRQTSILTQPEAVSEWPSRYFDPSGNNLVTPLDALRVINEIARMRRGSAPEGESRLASPTSPLLPLHSASASGDVSILDSASSGTVLSQNTRRVSYADAGLTTSKLLHQTSTASTREVLYERESEVNDVGINSKLWWRVSVGLGFLD